MQFLDSHGWPVVTFKGRPIINFIRRVLHTRKIKLGTWQQTHDRSNDSNNGCSRKWYIDGRLYRHECDGQRDN